MSSDPPKSKGAPGWNDPPMFSYNSQVQGTQAAKLNLTKRVSFPLSSPNATSQVTTILPGSLPPVGLPPATSVGPPPSGSPSIASLPVSSPASSLPGHVISCSQDDNSINSSEDITFHQVYSNLESQISKLNEKTAIEVKKKIATLETLWNEKKFNLPVQQRILSLSQAIKEENVVSGNELQRSLMVDHAALCSSWIPALRTILNSLESAQAAN